MSVFHSAIVRRPARAALGALPLMPAFALALALALFAPARSPAQAGVGDIVYTVGTVTRDGNGRDWAYLLWQATQPALISNRVFAVYAKPGDPTNQAPYLRQSVVMLQTDARVIEPLLRRAENLGDGLVALQADLLQIFGSLMPSNAISRAEQLSAVIRGSRNDARAYANLLLLARHHPGVNLALGFADAEIIGPGRTTFEIRAYDMAADKDLAVIGRVTVEAGHPTILPPPGPPVLVPEASPMGDLNLKLRWGTPDELRRLGLMQFGYNLYRVTRSYALSQGWNAANPPPISSLTDLVVTQPAVAKRVNRVPITPGKLLTPAEAANVLPPTGDTNTMFIMDDDGRGRSNYVNYGFTNGAQYFYYATARDVLGRDGAPSPGLLATVCDRMPPMPPTSVHVLNDYRYDLTTKMSNQALRVTWKQSPNTNDLTTNYWIYRWTSLTQMHALSADVTQHLIAKVSHAPNAVFNSYLDIGPASPNPATDAGETFWYTVRAGDAGACGQNLSGPGGPAFGVLRDRLGPAAGSGIIEINCLRPVVSLAGLRYLPLTNGADLVNYDFNLTCRRLSPRFEWAEFYGVVQYVVTGAGATNVTNSFGRSYYLGDPAVSVSWTPPRALNGGQAPANSATIRCRAGFFDGRVSDYAVLTLFRDGSPLLPNDRLFANVDFVAEARTLRTIAGDPKDRDCHEHDPNGGGGTTSNLCVHLNPSTGSKEYRLYRRVDQGAVSLLRQGPVTNVALGIDICDNAMPVNGGNLCFYLQLLDENGNPSPMTLIGCVDVAPNSPLPVPVLAKIIPTGNNLSPGMNLSWFCPPYGVDRFEVRIAGLPTPPVTNGFALSAQLSFTGAPPASMTFSNFGTNLTLSFYPAITPKAGPGFGNNGAEFVVPCDVQLGKTYVVTVRALGQNNNAGQFSNVETFVWNPTNAPSPQVPWPARGLPSANPNFAGLAFFLSPTNAAEVLRTGGYTGNGVLIGFSSIGFSKFSIREGRPTVFGAYDPNAAPLTNQFGEKIFPCALYRFQVPNANFPVTSGDVIQVSPLMENIAYQLTGVPGQTTNAIIQDPFVTATATTVNGSFATPAILWLWLKDTQPQIAGARYRYVLVRFKANREIDQLIPTTEVVVP